MIGNDIVDLQLASKQSNWQRRGWLQKIFTIEEQQCIKDSKTPETLVWKFWCMKEAAYKAHQRRFSISPKFNPKNFECLLDNKVRIDNHTYTIYTEATTEYVYSIVKKVGIDYYSKIYDREIDLKYNLKQMIAQKLNISLSIAIEKDSNRIPVVHIHKKETDIQISMTHHGRYSAVVLVTG